MEENVREQEGWAGALRKGWFVWGIIPLILILGYLPGLGARDLRLEEGRRATPAAEMAASGNWIVPTLYGEPYLNKPPLFWVVAAVGETVGKVDEFSVRIPSVLSVLAGAWILCGLGKGKEAFAKEARVLGGLILMAMPIMLDKGTLGEIDAMLSVLVFAAVASIWWGFDSATGRVHARGWLLAGVLLGLAGLLKGPPGLVEFYAAVVPFLIFSGKGRWKTLFSVWHLLLLILALAPMALWVWALCAKTGLSLADLLRLWRTQLGVDAFHGGSGGGEPVISTGSHYAWFGLRVVEMLLPWVVIGCGGFWKGFARMVGLEARARDLWMLLALSGPVLLAIFWAWPAATPRHMMMVAFPVSGLVALVMATPAAWKFPQIWMRWMHALAGMMAVGIGVIGAAGIVLAASFSKSSISESALIAAGAIFLSVLAVRWTLRTPVSHAALACGCTLAVLMVVGRGAVSAVFLPYKAGTDATRIVRTELQTLIPPGEQIFTTRTISGGRGDNYYNVQFYLTGAKAVTDFHTLPSGQRVAVVCTPDEVIPLELAVAEWKELGVAKGAAGLGDLVVVEVKR